VPGTIKTRRAYLLGNPDKPSATQALADLCAFAAARCEIAGSATALDGRLAVDAGADRLIVIGGDGTLIGVARSLGAQQIPMIGVNVGKLGFLTEFSAEELKADFDRAMSDAQLLSPRAILHVAISSAGGAPATHLAVNDCVIQAGPPFRLVTLGVSINGDHLTEIGGDGLIVCTPGGSTGHNLSAGGPIMQPVVDAIVLTPLCPHSLTHKPLVIERQARIEIEACRANEGSTLIIDGQVSAPFRTGDRVTIRRFEADYLIVRNPQHADWHKLVTKLHWGRPPSYE